MTEYSSTEIIEKLREACEKKTPKGAKRGGQLIWAKKHGISPQYLSEILRATKPLPEHVVRILDKKLHREEIWTSIPGSEFPKRLKSFREMMKNVKYDDN